MTDKPSTHFMKQNDKEKVSRFSQLEKSQVEMTIWAKGSSAREKFSCIRFNKEKMHLVVTTESSTTLAEKKILYAFSINGVNYFGEGDLETSISNTFNLDCSNNLFKSERRENFRLLTYPHYDVYIQVPFEENLDVEKSNVVSFETGMSQTGLFKNFLQIVGDDDKSIKKDHAKFRVLDISVTGLSFQIGEIEKKYLETKRVILSSFLFFNEEIHLPSVEVRYIIPLVKAQGSAYKVGIQFLDVGTTLDEKLGKIINKAMRSFEHDFEDFLK
jgi:predicted transport protein